MDNGSQSEMTLERLQYGGFIVKSGHREPGAYNAAIYAATSIDDALKFMRAAIAPVGGPSAGNGISDVMERMRRGTSTAD